MNNIDQAQSIMERSQQLQQPRNGNTLAFTYVSVIYFIV